MASNALLKYWRFLSDSIDCKGVAVWWKHAEHVRAVLEIMPQGRHCGEAKNIFMMIEHKACKHRLTPARLIQNTGCSHKKR